MVFNNPEVPGLVYKLAPMDEKIRKLPHVRKLWEGIFDVCEVKDVFTGKPVNTKQYDIDHFIPWSFVMNDELWNLMPMDSSLNSSKKGFLSGNLSLKYNLHSIWAVRELYTFGKNRQEFCHILEKNMQPVYDSARRQGYEIWNRDKAQLYKKHFYKSLNIFSFFIAGLNARYMIEATITAITALTDVVIAPILASVLARS